MRSPRIKISTVIFLFALAGSLLIGLLAAPQAISEKSQGKKETTIRNMTRGVVQYTIRRVFASSTAVERDLKVDALDRWPCATFLDVTFERGRETITYRLECGRPYSFRLDENDELELYEGAHGLFGIADLAPFVPTPMAVVEEMLKLAQISKEDIVYDLGCGDGRILIEAAGKYGARGVGIDIDPERIKEAEAAALKAGVEKLVEFRVQDVLNADFSAATIVTLYLLPESNDLLRPLLEKQLKPGVIVVSHNYSITDWEQKEIAYSTLKDSVGEEHTIYVYKR